MSISPNIALHSITHGVTSAVLDGRLRLYAHCLLQGVMSPEAGTSLQEMGIKSSGKGQTPQLEGGLNWQPGGAEDWSCASCSGWKGLDLKTFPALPWLRPSCLSHVPPNGLLGVE